VGRHVFGIAVLYFGVVDFFFRNYDAWQQLYSLTSSTAGTIVVDIAAAGMIAGGLAVQWQRTLRPGAGALGAVFLFFALCWIPKIVASPGVYGTWGSFFEEYSLVAAAALLLATAAPQQPWSARLARFAYFSFAVCVVSFTLEQAFYLSDTAGFVPKWIPPSQMFWADFTTIAFALAAIGLLTGIQALAAARWLTVMILGFGALLWLPALAGDRGTQLNWGANGQNTAIAGAAWIVADYLGARRRKKTGDTSTIVN
jgi:hypothetical protein